MKKTILLLTLIILLTSFVNAATEECYTFNTDATGYLNDSISDQDMSGTAQGFVAGKLDEAIQQTSVGGNNVKINMSNFGTVKTLDYWVKTDDSTTNDMIGVAMGTAEGGDWFLNDRVYLYYGIGGADRSAWIIFKKDNVVQGNCNADTGFDIAPNEWNHIVMVFDDNNELVVYHNGSNVYNCTASITPPTNWNLMVGNNRIITDGNVDNVYVSSERFSTTDVANSYNNGNGLECYEMGATSFSNVKVKNRWNNSNIVGVNVTLSNGVSNLTQSDGIAYFYNTTGNLDFNTSFANYFNSSNTTSENQTVEITIFQSQISPNCFEKITNNSLTCLNTTVYPNAGLQNLTISATGYYPVTQEKTITALDNKTINMTGFYSANLSLKSQFITGSGTGNCNYITTGITYPTFTETSTTTNTNTSIGLINGTYQIRADCQGYAYSYQNITINQTTQNITFQLYQTNSINITIYDENTGNPILQNVTILKIASDDTQTTNITNTSKIYLHDITPDNYTFKFYSNGYSTRSYPIIIGNKSHQTLNAYLLQSNYSVVFTIKNEATGINIENAICTIQRTIADTPVVVASLTSDITGRIQFYYEPDYKYDFTCTHPNYQTKIFSLDPIIFSSYDINMEQSTTQTDNTDYSRISITYTPKYYNNNANNTITFTFANPTGELETYGFNATYKNNTITQTGTNAYGAILTDTIEITSATLRDKITIEWHYKLSNGNTKTFKETYTIHGSSTSDYTFTSNRDQTYGLGIYERVLISNIIIIIIAGLTAYFAGGIASGAIALLISGYLVKIGFIPIWLILPGSLVIFIALLWRSTQ